MRHSTGAAAARWPAAGRPNGTKTSTLPASSRTAGQPQPSAAVARMARSGTMFGAVETVEQPRGGVELRRARWPVAGMGNNVAPISHPR